METLAVIAIALCLLGLLVVAMTYAIFWVLLAFALFITMMVMLFSGAIGPALGFLILASLVW